MSTRECNLWVAYTVCADKGPNVKSFYYLTKVGQNWIYYESKQKP